MALRKDEFQHLFESHFDALRTHIFYRCGDTDLASDLAQEAFMRLWEKRESLHTEHLKALLYKIANDCFVSSYRRKQTRDAYAKYCQVSHVGESPHEQMAYEETKQRYVKVLTEMPEGQRVAFLLSRNEELSYAEIAFRLQISVKAVEKRISSALSLLRKNLLE